jgi:hypothetical protein
MEAGNLIFNTFHIVNFFQISNYLKLIQKF